MIAPNIQTTIYTRIVKPIFFRLNPEKVHDRTLVLGKILGKFRATQIVTSSLFQYQDPILEQDVLGIHFKNPIGLAAGFDKNAELTQILPHVGFGFEEIGSITGEYCEGNPKPRLWRHPEQKSLRVYYGLKNNGCEEIANRLSKNEFEFPIGVSIAKTNCKETVEINAAIADYKKAYKTLQHTGDYDTINISCPNAHGGQPFTDPERLNTLLSALVANRNQKPMFLKLSPDLTIEELDSIASIAKKHAVNGLICGNLTKKHELGKGGLSGKPVEHLVHEHLKFLHENYPEFVIISCGGVFNAEDAYERICAGASLVQLATGMIYQGPQIIGKINYDLTKLLKRDGYKNISEAIGTANKRHLNQI